MNFYRINFNTVPSLLSVDHIYINASEEYFKDVLAHIKGQLPDDFNITTELVSENEKVGKYFVIDENQDYEAIDEALFYDFAYNIQSMTDNGEVYIPFEKFDPEISNFEIKNDEVKRFKVGEGTYIIGVVVEEGSPEFIKMFPEAQYKGRTLSVNGKTIRLSSDSAKWLIDNGAVYDCGDADHGHDLHLDPEWKAETDEDHNNFVLAIAGML